MPLAMKRKKPIVFACAGCSIVAKLSWELAHELDSRGIAEMSCLAGVGAQKKVFLNKLRDREVWVIDGCPIECGHGIFDLVGRPIDRHIRLADLGYKKNAEPEGGVDMDQLIEAALASIGYEPVDDVSPVATMHDNVETWDDVCCCEPEPRWQAVADELEQADASKASAN